MRVLTPKILRLRLQLLLYTNMGADALGSYSTLPPPEWSWKLGLDRQQTTQGVRQQKRMVGGGHEKMLAMSTRAPAGSQG